MREGQVRRWLLGALVLAVLLAVMLVVLRSRRQRSPSEPPEVSSPLGGPAAQPPRNRSDGTAGAPSRGSAAGAAPSARPSLPAETERQRELARIMHPAAPSSAPQAWPTTPTDGGLRQLDRDAVRAGIHAVIPKVRRCYEDYLRAAPDTAPQEMRIKADFTIVAKNGEGRISDGEAIPYAGGDDAASLQDVTLRSCLLQSLTTARFPVPPGDGRVRVKYPFLMRRGKPP